MPKLSKTAQATLARLEAELVGAEGLTALDKLLDEFVRENLRLIWEKLDQGVRFPYRVSPLLLKLIDKAKPSPIAMKVKAEGFRLEVIHRLEKPEDTGPQQLTGVEVIHGEEAGGKDSHVPGEEPERATVPREEAERGEDSGKQWRVNSGE